MVSTTASLTSLSEFLARPRTRAALAAHVEPAFPKEACALIVRGEAGLKLVLAENLADVWHAIDPLTFPHAAEDAYILDPRLIVAAAARGEDLVAIVHSHCRIGAYFSAEDRRLALTDDGLHPLFPGVSYVVLDVQDDGLCGWKTFRWAPEARTFIESSGATASLVECGVAPDGTRAVEDRPIGAKGPFP